MTILIAATAIFSPFVQAQSIFTLPDGRTTARSGQLYRSLSGIELSPQSTGLLDAADFNILSESFIAGTALLNQTGDRLGSLVPLGNGTFFDISGGKSRYNTGSHVDLTSFSLLAGISQRVKLTQSSMTLGAFLEYGNGDYEPFNSFVHADTVRGEGNVHHFGGGLLGRVNFNHSGLYTEGSFRAGNVRNEFGGINMGSDVRYDSSSPYLGMHLGLGNVRRISHSTSLDLYGKYFWTQQDSDTVTLPGGNSVLFHDTNSHRLQFGGRVNNMVNSQLCIYWGAAWGQEFAATARGSSGGYFFGGPTLKRDTVLGELGVTWKPMKNGGLFLDVGIQGYFGKREGIAGGLQLRWQPASAMRGDCRAD